MEAFYFFMFGLAASVAGMLEIGNRMLKGTGVATTTEFAKFRNNYLLVYSLMMGKCTASGGYRRLSSTTSGQGPCMPRMAPVQCHAYMLTIRSVQPATGCKARTYTPSTSTTASAGATLAGCSSRDLVLP